MGTVKWLEPDGWHGWINGLEFVSFGINEVCDLVASQIPGDVTWEVRSDKLMVSPDTSERKISKSNA